MNRSERKQIILRFMEETGISFSKIAYKYGLNPAQVLNAVKHSKQSNEWVYEYLSDLLGKDLSLSKNRYRNKDYEKVVITDNLVDRLICYGKTVVNDEFVQNNEIKAIIEHLQIKYNLNVRHITTTDELQNTYHYLEVIK